MTLYEINQAILDLVDPETGEVLDWEALNRLNLAREEKLEGVALWMKNIAAEMDAIRAEEKRLAERRKSLERKHTSLTSYLTDALNGEKFETARCSVNFRKTTRVEIADMIATAVWAENNMPDIVTRPAPTVSKTELARLLKDGREIPGCELVSDVSMSVK